MSIMKFYTSDDESYFFDIEYLSGVFTQHARFTLGVVFLYLMTVIVWKGTKERLMYGLFNCVIVACAITVRVLEVKRQIVNRTGPTGGARWDYDNIHNLIWHVIMGLFVVNVAIVVRKKSFGEKPECSKT